jgi:hypothetical protein
LEIAERERKESDSPAQEKIRDQMTFFVGKRVLYVSILQPDTIELKKRYLKK